jgi:hypothetical protein
MSDHLLSIKLIYLEFFLSRESEANFLAFVTNIHQTNTQKQSRIPL